jgi:signal transduction histidine kinase
MRKSIQFKLFISIIIILLFTTFVGFTINSGLFKNFYISNQKKELLKNAQSIETLLINDDKSSVETFIDQLTENNGYIIYYANSLINLPNRNPSLGKGRLNNKFMQELDSLKDEHTNYMFSIYYNEDYNNNFLRLLFVLENKKVLIIESPIEIINISAKFSLIFYLYISAFTIILGGIFSYFFARWFTKPIILLNEQAKSIANLEFKKKFKMKNDDEIGTLGKNMNYLSDTLEETITTLHNDIDEKVRLEKMRKTFIANISHEFKTPIALIRGYSEGLLYNINEKKDEYVNIIIDETDKMDNLVKELLELSDLESGKTSLEITTFDLSSLVDEILYKYNQIFSKNNIIVTTDKNDIININADSNKIEEVITNFINNALKHIDEDKQLSIEIKQLENKIRLSVYNSGKNIPANSLDDIWTSFYKLDKSRNRESGSTGLGLYIVKIIIERHNGIYGINNLDNGVEFFFEI